MRECSAAECERAVMSVPGASCESARARRRQKGKNSVKLKEETTTTASLALEVPVTPKSKVPSEFSPRRLAATGSIHVRLRLTRCRRVGEFLQSRKRTLPIAKVLPLSADGKTTDLSRPHDEPEPWEDDLLEKWPAMQLRLEVQLRANPLDYENKPFSEKTGDGVVDGKTTDGTPVNIKWIPPMGDGNTKQNSDHLMMNLKFWDLELPNMVLLVQGGHMHPYALVRGKMLADQRADF